jgi:Zn-dependent M16 (insulinase) family peptidase
MNHSSSLQFVGQRYQNFIVNKIIQIPELQCALYELTHEPSGAIVMHIANADPENLFCLSFQTLPYNSNGVAHILEHTVLCGSQKFPVKDPFFAMNRRSLNTFMNALTGSDFTCYPAASQIHKDFYNLLEVYLDAVFHPNLSELSFLQEGCRLEFATPDNPNSPLEYKGIVYNEMKGALSSATARMIEALNAALFPDVTYGYNSGGDPKVIPSLTYQELKDFHQTYYHPSRCLFFFYGDMPLEDHLDFIATHTLNATKKAPRLPSVVSQPRFTKPVYQELKYPVAPDEELANKAMMAFGWLTCHILEQEEALALSVLQIMLLDTDASPLKMPLLKSGYCKQVNAFIDAEITDIPWVIILKGCDAKNADLLEEIIKVTLQQISQEGIALQLVENAIHQLEFSRSEIGGDHSPFGLSLFMRSALLKQHEATPEEGLVIHALFDRLRQEVLANPAYFGQLIQKYLLNNAHFARIVMVPDAQLGGQEEAEEKQALEDIKAALSAEQKQQIIAKAQELEEFQKKQEEEDIDVLPMISINEVPSEARDYPLMHEQVGVLDVFYHNTFTNDIVYADLVFELPELTEEEMPFLRLLTTVLTQMGCNGRSYIENLEYIQGQTGGIGAGISLNIQAHDYTIFSPTFHLRGKALHRKASKLFPLMLETIKATRLDDMERLKEIIFKHYTGMESRLSQSALKFAINLSASSLSVPAKITNDMYGLPYFWTIRDIVQNFEQQGPQVLAKLQKLQEKIMTLAHHPQLVLSCDEAIYNELKAHQFYGLANIQTAPFNAWQAAYPLDTVPSQGRFIASSVAFIAKTLPSVPYTHPHAPAISVLSFLLDNITLHARIREQGGAYGGGSVSNLMLGNFYFYSYRDPNISKTLQAFEEAVNEIAKGKFDEQDLEEAKLELVQVLDNPVAPGSRAELAYGWWKEGKTLEVRQHFRTQMLALTCEDIQRAVQDIIIPEMKKAITAIFADKGMLQEENALLQADGLSPFPIEGI